MKIDRTSIVMLWILTLMYILWYSLEIAIAFCYSSYNGNILIYSYGILKKKKSISFMISSHFESSYRFSGWMDDFFVVKIYISASHLVGFKWLYYTTGRLIKRHIRVVNNGFPFSVDRFKISLSTYFITSITWNLLNIKYFY